MGEWHFSAHLDELVVDVLDGYFVRLITAGPDHQVGALQVPGLLHRRCSLDQLDPLLTAVHDALIQPLSVASEARERVEKAVLVGEVKLLVVRVSVGLRLVHTAIEDPDSIAVQDCDVTWAKLW